MKDAKELAVLLLVMVAIIIAWMRLIQMGWINA